MSSKTRVWLAAVCYGIWAGFLAVVTFAAIDVFFFDISPSLGRWLPVIPVATIVAAIAWALIHLRHRRQGPGTYIVLAVLVVIVSHLAMPIIAMGGFPKSPALFVETMLFTFLLHFWFTVPIAIGATGLFVWSLMRWKAL